MIWIVVIGLIWLACLSFYLVSEKQIGKTRQSRYALLAAHPFFIKMLASGNLLSAMLLISTEWSDSISFVALWVLISPIVFIFILKINPFEKRQ